MLLTGYAYVLDPRTWDFLALAGYAFPFFALANVAFIAVWVLLRKRCLLVPVMGLVAAYVPMMKYSPVNLSKETPDGCLKVMTFNTWQLGTTEEEQTHEEIVQARQEMLRYIAEAECDVVCLQEVSMTRWIRQDFDTIVKPVMPYMEVREWCGNKMMILSKYPITKCERIEYKSVANFSYAFYLDVKGRELIVLNNHLETNHFSTEEKQDFGRMVKGGMEREEARGNSFSVISKLTDAAKIRAAQADAVATFVSMHKGRAMIVCGDFNDIPLSYAANTMASSLTDCYSATANGPGFSYSKNGMYVRIDNMLCSQELTPYGCHIDKSCRLSDHYPLVCWLEM